MVMTDQEIIDSILKELENANKVSFRDSDLLRTFITAKDLTSPDLYYPNMEILPELVQTDYRYFKQKLIDNLSDHEIPFIQGPEDFLDIYANKNIYEDFVKAYTLQVKIDELDITASNPNLSDTDRVDALEKMYGLYN